MAISQSIENFFNQVHIGYDLVAHTVTDSAFQSSQASRITASSVVKAVLLKDPLNKHFVIAAIPASNKLMASWVSAELQRKLIIADEIEISKVFPDCTPGAVPGFGQAYNLDVIWDEQLAREHDLYFEAGNHKELIHIDEQQFKDMFEQHPHSIISLPNESYERFRLKQ